MDYKGKRIIITGYTGFIGNALANKLTDLGADVTGWAFDIRDKEKLREHIDHNVDYIFHFGSPSSQVLFKRNPEYCTDVTINGFLNLAHMCREYGIKLVYPSTGSLSFSSENEYSRCKKVLEDIHLGSNLDALGLRIFAGYGIGEAHKRDYASLPYLLIKEIMDGRSPVIYGDGEQVRDFIYIDDIVFAILKLAENCSEKIVDIGSGERTSFNHLIDIIRAELGTGEKPTYVKKPENYIDSTKADIRILQQYKCLPVVNIYEGIKKIISYEKSNRNNDN